MPRKPRFYLPDVACHVVQRGVRGQPCFFSDADYAYYLECLQEAAVDYSCQIHAYVLMPNHIHLLLTPSHRDGVSRLMQSIGRRYVQRINRDRDRSGTLWEGRHRASLVEDGDPLVDCLRYIETNPVRSGLAAQPGDYRWSSCQWHGFGRPCRVVDDHPAYERLGAGPEERQCCYQAMLCRPLSAATLERIRDSLNGGMPLGGRGFCRYVETELRLRLGHLKRGRPRKRGGGMAAQAV